MRRPIPSWFRPAPFVVAIGVVLLLLVVLHPLPGRDRFVAEATVYLLLLLACASHEPIRRVARQIGVARLVVFTLVFGFATWVQLRKIYGPVYPFVSWTMYGSKNPPPAYVRYDVTLASGREIAFPLADLAPGSSTRALLTHFNRRLRHLEEVPEDPSVIDPSLHALQRLLIDVAQVYNARNPDDPIRAFHTSGCTIPIREYDGPDSIQCELLLTFAMPEEGVR
jgi:hypothetical protein